MLHFSVQAMGPDEHPPSASRVPRSRQLSPDWQSAAEPQEALAGLLAGELVLHAATDAMRTKKNDFTVGPEASTDLRGSYRL